MSSIKINNLSFAYESGGKLILKDINTEIGDGEFVCILGQSGCGKSTLLRLLAGLETATEGEILNDGEVIGNPSLNKGVVFQDYGLFPWMTAGENIMLALKQTNLNMMFSLLLCLGVVWVADHVKHKGEKMLWLCVLVICSLWTDWALLAPVFTMLFANAYGDRKKVSLAYGKAVGLFFLLNVLSYRADCGLESALIHSACACIGPAASGVVIQCMYNKADKTAHGWEKWFFYGFYPVHLLLLWMIQFAKV